MAKGTLQVLLLFAIIVYSLASSSYENDVESQQTTANQDPMQQLFKIEGKVSVIDDKLQNGERAARGLLFQSNANILHCTSYKEV